jgi:hypothetical protein
MRTAAGGGPSQKVTRLLMVFSSRSKRPQLVRQMVMSLSFDIDEKFNCYQYDQNERDNPEKALKQGLFNYLFDSSVNHLSRR